MKGGNSILIKQNIPVPKKRERKNYKVIFPFPINGDYDKQNNLGIG